MKNEVWVLGATGRTGRAIARGLHTAAIPLVLVGRDRGRLETAAAALDGAPRLLVGSLASTLGELARDAPAVVVNTVGPFTTTAADVARACPPGTHYLDLSNEFAATEQILALDRQAAAQDQVYVTGAGFGVLATEAVLLRLCANRPRPQQVRVDALGSVAPDGGVLGAALAATIVEVLAFGGREVQGGRVVRAPLAARREQLTTPNGAVVGTSSGPSGELLAAWRASDADTIVSASAAAPSRPLLRLVLPTASALMHLGSVRRLAVRRIAKIRPSTHDTTEPVSWAHARAAWPDGTVRDGWLQAGDGHDFTAAVAVSVTRRLLAGEGRPGAHTPGALFGPELAEAAGGRFIL